MYIFYIFLDIHINMHTYADSTAIPNLAAAALRWRQGESTIDLCATINFMSRTVQSATRHDVMRIIAPSAPLLFGHGCHVAALLSSMTCHRENHVTTGQWHVPEKRQRKQKRNKSHWAV